MRTVVLTFDNLGEAAEEERGTWRHPPDDASHPSIDVALPWLLDLLAELGLPATFFVEGINAVRHPDALRAIARAGHEVGLHAWHHDRWGTIDEAGQSELLARGVGAFADLGLAPTSFRPPGGSLTDGSLELLAGAGFDCCSPAADGPALHTRDAASGIVLVPFRWALVDALYLHAPLAQRRAAAGLGEGPLDLAQAFGHLAAELERDDPATLVLHPFLMVDPGARPAYESLLRRLSDRRHAGEIAVLTCREAAGAFGEPGLYGRRHG